MKDPRSLAVLGLKRICSLASPAPSLTPLSLHPHYHHHDTTAPHHQEPAKMHIFLSFLFSMDNVNVWMKDEWLRLYDREFVENTLIAKYVY